MSRRIFSCMVMLFLWGCAKTPADAVQYPLITDAGLWVKATGRRTPSASAGTAEPTVSPTPNRTPVVQESTGSSMPSTDPGSGMTLAFVGDIMLARSLGDRIERGEGEAIFASVEGILQSADITVGNLECALGTGGKKAAKAYTFLAPSKSAPLLRDAGFDLITLANNHSLDFGLDVFAQTEALLSENGIRTVGAGSDESKARAPAIFEAGGIRIAFLAYADVPVEYLSKFDARDWSAGPSTPGISWADDGKIKQDVQAVRGNADYIVVLFHFGTEGLETPDRRQIQLARLAVDSGANMVVGAHSHQIQGVEQYKDGWIFYSLGNFVFDGFAGESNRSVILWVRLTGQRELTYSLMPLKIIDGIPTIGE